MVCSVPWWGGLVRVSGRSFNYSGGVEGTFVG
jgi:hypothetical protein